MTEALLRLPHAEAQTVLVLLRFCCGPRLSYWLRSLPFLWAEWLAQEADRSSFGDLDRFVDSFGVVFDSVDGRRLRAQLALPPSRGGLGLCGRHLMVPAAQVAAWSNVLRILGRSSPDLSSLWTSLCEHEYSPSSVIRSRCAVPISLCALPPEVDLGWAAGMYWSQRLKLLLGATFYESWAALLLICLRF